MGRRRHANVKLINLFFVARVDKTKSMSGGEFNETCTIRRKGIYDNRIL